MAWLQIQGNRDGLLTGTICLGLYSKGYGITSKVVMARVGGPSVL